MSDYAERLEALGALAANVWARTGLDLPPEINCLIGLRSLTLWVDQHNRICYRRWLDDYFDGVDGFEDEGVIGLSNVDGVRRLIEWVKAETPAERKAAQGRSFTTSGKAG